MVVVFVFKIFNVFVMFIEEMKKEFIIDLKEINGNNEMCLYSLKKI